MREQLISLEETSIEKIRLHLTKLRSHISFYDSFTIEQFSLSLLSNIYFQH